MFPRNAIQRRKQAIRQKTLKKIHPILTYGVGVSIVQFTDDAKIELELKNRIPSSAIIKNIDKITLKGFY